MNEKDLAVILQKFLDVPFFRKFVPSLTKEDLVCEHNSFMASDEGPYKVIAKSLGPKALGVGDSPTDALEGLVKGLVIAGQVEHLMQIILNVMPNTKDWSYLLNTIEACRRKAL